jgi:hypothetical protein
MIEIGDKVKFLNAVGGGKVIAFQSKKVAVVEDHDGFEIPVLISELVKIDEAPVKKVPPRAVEKQKRNKPTTPKKEATPNTPVMIEGNDEPRFFMAFAPSNTKNLLEGEIEIFLVNDSNFSLLYHYSQFDGKLYKTIDAGLLEPNSKSYLDGIAQSDLNQLPRFHFRLIPYRKEEKSLTPPITKEISLNALKFYKEKNFTNNEYFNTKAMLFDLVTHPMKEAIDQLTDKDFKEVVEAKDKANRPRIKEKEKIIIPENVEVDLHIENLIDNASGLSNHEILEIQMKHFHDEIKAAIEKRVKRIIFIHGVGNGVLKQEIHRKLKSTYARYYFQDASFQEYGYGATLVILRKS